MSSLEEKVALYTKALSEKAGVSADETLLKSITKAMGPSIYNADAESVSTSDKAEVKTFKENFLKKKLELADSEADSAFDSAVDTIGKSNTRKYRAVLAYLCVESTGKQSLFA